ncbi:MAG: HAMP domain-containing histidine kinase [Chloroflexi bacterium]|nr:HAMP domain-containing histidine kinase [Chloroflexota bacterium]
MSLRLRLTIIYSALTGGILLLLGVVTTTLISISLISQTDEMLAQVVNKIVTNMYVDPLGGPTVFLPQLNPAENVYVQIWDTQGNLVSASPGLGSFEEPLDPVGLQAGKAIYRDVYISQGHLRTLSMTVVLGGHPFVVIQAATSLSLLDATLRNLVNILVGMTLFATLLAALASWFGVGQALAPLKTVTDTALQITRADDLSRRIPYRGQDNDEVGQLIYAFNETLERLEKLFLSQQRFLADVSHELRTPLTVIKGNADLMRRMKRLDEESLTSIKDEADRLTRLVGDLLLLTQAESGKLPLDFKPVELDTLLLDVSKEMHVLARERVQLKVTDIDQIQVNGDRDRLKQVLLNLVSNAIKYTPQGGEVFLSLSKVGGQARLIVRDSGPGIPAEDLPHIFERFYRAEKSRTRSESAGFGLGLSIANWIVTHHAGRIEVNSQEGKGTTFCIWLPLFSVQ